ncbi:hypothetical protein [Erwinia tasmaniensis]|uniref:hypothetical protein n=1 Tax=Erwinia tasmaniensis TaxID=338565 RepID=UPI003A4DDFC3
MAALNFMGGQRQKENSGNATFKRGVFRLWVIRYSATGELNKGAFQDKISAHYGILKGSTMEIRNLRLFNGTIVAYNTARFFAESCLM